MNPSFRLRSALQSALTGALATLPLGCGADPGPGIEEDPAFVAQACEAGKAQWVSDVQAAEAVDYVALVQQFPAMVVTEAGEACGGATDRVACLAELGELPTDQGFGFGYNVQVLNLAQLRATRGDAVILVADQAQLLTFLGDIDTPGEAMLVAAAAGYAVPCDGGGARPAAGGFEVQAYTYPGCNGETRHLLSVNESGAVETVTSTVIVEPDPNCVVGRRPAGLSRGAPQDETRLGGYLARAAELEAASVPAFCRLEGDLRRLGAPHRLQVAARRAGTDEVRHARVVARLARRYGTCPRPVRVDAQAPRGLEEVARENVVEGCVRETFGVLVAQWQARTARDTHIAREYARIAEDETRHAELAWEIAAWAEEQLDAQQSERVRWCRDAAVAELQRQLEREPSKELQSFAGLPSSGQSLRLVRSLHASLWA